MDMRLLDVEKEVGKEVGVERCNILCVAMREDGVEP